MDDLGTPQTSNYLYILVVHELSECKIVMQFDSLRQGSTLECSIVK